MASITLLRKSTVLNPNNESYTMNLQITSSEDVTKYIMVNQRIKDFVKNNFDDVFAAVCTPVLLEDLDINSPSAGTSYYRTDTVKIIANNLGYLEEIFNAIVYDIQQLVQDVEALNDLQPDGIYTISANHIDVNMAILHTHYRLPLIARPCGTNSFSSPNYSVGSQDTTLQGWLNADDNAPAGFHFMYNIATDTALNSLWPIDPAKVSYAHLEVDGVTKSTSAVQINANGIYWQDNTNPPWPANYVSLLSPGSPALVLVLDIIV